jgi:acyl-CoA dehydrogenase
MTQPAVASSDATNVQLRMVPDGDEYVLNGRKWFASNALHAYCKILIVMGKTDVTAAPLLAGKGDGFMISQARLGPGRIHHCMRAIGMAERAHKRTIAQAELRRVTPDWSRKK